MDNLADNIHFNLSYPDFSQQTPLHVIHQHQQDPSFQDLPTSYSSFSLLPSSVTPQLHQPTNAIVNKEIDSEQHRQLLPSSSEQPHHQHEEQQSTITSSSTASLNLFSPSSSSSSSSPGSCSSMKTTPSRTRVTRPPNAFLLFNKEMRKRLKIDNPSWTVSDISKEIGDRWRALSQEEKHQYVIHANKIKESQQALHPNAMYIRRSKAELTEAGHYEKVEKKRADCREQQQSFTQVMVTAAVGPSPSPPSSSSSTTTTTTTTTTMDATATSSPSLTRTISSASSSSSSSTLINARPMGTVTALTGMADPNRFFVGTENTGDNGTTYLISQAPPTATATATATRSRAKRTRRKHKRDRNPGAPKHPLSAYMWFLTEVRSETRQSYPGSTVGQISKVCADRWHAMAEDDRLPYLTMASTDKARYAREMRVYASQNNHTMGRGTRQKYRASSPTLLLASIDAGLPEQQQQHHHHGLFYAPVPSSSSSNTSGTTTPSTTATASSSSSSPSTSSSSLSSSSQVAVSTTSSSPFQPSTSSILRNSLPGNVAMQDTMNPSELLQPSSSSSSSSSMTSSSSNLHHHHHHHHHHHNESY
ncbi:hypothetical protein BCR42DRAFT_401644 [Absidia repens]|uniref:HMG box domain-containing protein n=1 Tax=Absidia repens TaxID=90262 RepID=A0A1X2J2S9_9FUNG|nr:hypothetical protein BCR42DRAFT_401644 [Absidia repens]